MSSRPKSDKATIIGAVLAALALGWTVYAYFAPRTPPIERNLDSRPSASPAEPDLAQPNDDGVSRALREAKTSAARTWRVLDERFQEDRRNRSWWALLLIWLVWMGVFIVRAILMYGAVWQIPAAGLVYLWYFWPALSWWGVTVSTLAGIVCWIVAWLEDL